jgi:hypothetical protein
MCGHPHHVTPRQLQADRNTQARCGSGVVVVRS